MVPKTHRAERGFHLALLLMLVGAIGSGSAAAAWHPAGWIMCGVMVAAGGFALAARVRFHRLRRAA